MAAGAAAVLGVVLAGIAYSLFFTGGLAWLNLVLWAAIAFAVGAASRSIAGAIATTATMGFAIVLTYSILGYQASRPLVVALPLFAVVALLGAMAMAGAAALGHAIRRGNHPTPSR